VKGAVRSIGRVFAFIGLFLILLIPLQLALDGLVAGAGGDALLLGTASGAVAATLAGVVLLRILERRPGGALGIAWTSRTPAEIAIGLAIGTLAIGAVAGLLSIAGFVRYTGDAGSVGSWLWTLAADFGLLAVAAYAEEALFRGYAFQVLVRGFGAVAATLFASGLFALAHSANPNVGGLALVNLFLAGVLLSVAYLRTASLWFATAVHLGWNWGMASLLDLPVSGITQLETPLYEPVVSGPEWLTGGAFGPEAGLPGTLAFAAALVLVLRWRRIAPAPEMRALGPLIVDPEKRVA
jgi:hypothetical protein